MVGEEVLIGEGMLLDMGEGRQSSQGLDKNKREGGGGGIHIRRRWREGYGGGGY